MCDFEKMYYIMFNAASDAVSVLQKYVLTAELDDIREQLITAQQQCEEIYSGQQWPHFIFAKFMP